MRHKPKEGATDYALIWVGRRGDLPEVCFSSSLLSAIYRYRLHGVIFWLLSIFFIFLISIFVGFVWVWSRGFARRLRVCFGGLSFGITPKLGVTRCVPPIYKILLWHSNGGATAPPGAHSDYNFLPQFSLYLCTLKLRFTTWASKQLPCQNLGTQKG